MKLAISNIAWPSAEETTVAKLLQEMNIKGVEVAPTAIWSYPLTVSDAVIQNYRGFWESRGIQIVAMQALLFRREDLKIFEDPEKRIETLAYLSGMIRLGNKLGAKVLVFGSPKNRKVGSLRPVEIDRIAIPFFYELGQLAAQSHVVLCIEPNPTVYDCDFITTSSQGLELVRKVGSPGFGLHLDAGAMTLSGESIEVAIEASFDELCHFHISEPQLARIGTGGVDHKVFAGTLGRLQYKNWVSIEMRAQTPAFCIENVAAALTESLYCYGES